MHFLFSSYVTVDYNVGADISCLIHLGTQLYSPRDRPKLCSGGVAENTGLGLSVQSCNGGIFGCNREMRDNTTTLQETLLDSRDVGLVVDGCALWVGEGIRVCHLNATTK